MNLNLNKDKAENELSSLLLRYIFNYLFLFDYLCERLYMSRNDNSSLNRMTSVTAALFVDKMLVSYFVCLIESWYYEVKPYHKVWESLHVQFPWKKSLKCKEVSLYGKKQKHDVFLKTALNHISVICWKVSQLTYSLKLHVLLEPNTSRYFWKSI